MDGRPFVSISGVATHYCTLGTLCSLRKWCLAVASAISFFSVLKLQLTRFEPLFLWSGRVRSEVCSGREHNTRLHTSCAPFLI